MKKVLSYKAGELREFAETLRSRRTIELFLQKTVPEKLVNEAIEVAIWAPNHHVTEPWHFYRLGEETKQQCLDLCSDIVTAKKGDKAAEFKRRSWSEKPNWMVVTCKRSSNESSQLEDYAACCAAVQNLTLYLWKAGVGSKWTSGDIIRDPRFFEIVGINTDEEFVVGLIWYGYPKMTPMQFRKNRKDVSTDCP
ncbi:MAG: nitroreductase [Gammaproteobacteria bacterium]|jgi:nitroreductase|nr:nitroreductase [Gammaproteobacteria bacterium]